MKTLWAITRGFFFLIVGGHSWALVDNRAFLHKPKVYGLLSHCSHVTLSMFVYCKSSAAPERLHVGMEHVSWVGYTFASWNRRLGSSVLLVGVLAQDLVSGKVTEQRTHMSGKVTEQRTHMCVTSAAASRSQACRTPHSVL